MCEIPAIAICYRRENVSPIARSLEHDLRDPWKVFADRVSVVGISGTEFVKINLLIEIQISFGSLTRPGEARVINTGAVVVPSRAAARCGILHVRDRVRQCFSGRGFVKVKRAIFAAAFGQ